eukprot:1359493-Amphidinium_carterae.1
MDCSKSAESLPLHRVPPARPLGINPQITCSDFHWGQKAGKPGLLELVFSVRAIADNHSSEQSEVRKQPGPYRRHISYFNLPARTLQGAYQEGMQEIDSKAATKRQPARAFNKCTHRTLNEDAPAPTIHVQSTIESIKRKPSLNNKLLKLRKWHSLVAFRAVQENYSLMLTAGIPSLSFEG